MNKNNYINLVNDKLNSLKDIIDKKSHDYANDGDTLMNFKNLGQMFNKRASDMCLWFMAVKINRLINLSSKEKPSCESISDTVNDLINYACLYEACLIDEKTI